jgi:hypothetical protein
VFDGPGTAELAIERLGAADIAARLEATPIPEPGVVSVTGSTRLSVVIGL